MFQIWSWYEKNWGFCEILFMASYHKQPPGAIQTPFNLVWCIFLSQMSKFLCQYYSDHKKTTEYGILRVSPFRRYVFCQDYKSFDSKRP